MCYIGHNNTKSSIHIDICGTLGNNLMAWCDQESDTPYTEWYLVDTHHTIKAMEIIEVNKNKFNLN